MVERYLGVVEVARSNRVGDVSKNGWDSIYWDLGMKDTG